MRLASCQDTKAAEELKPYLQGFCKVCCTGIADAVASKVKRFDGGVVLQEIGKKSIEKTWLAGALIRLKMHGKHCGVEAVDNDCFGVH